MSKKKLKKNQKLIKEPKFPITSYKNYSKELRKAIIKELKKELDKKKFKNSYLKNSILSTIKSILSLFDSVFSRKKKKIKKIVKDFAESVNKIHEKRFNTALTKEDIEIKPKVKGKIEEAIKKRVEYNVSLIVSANERAKAKLREALFKNLDLGSPESIKEITQRTLKGYSNNLDLIARDQTLKFSKDLTVVRAEAIGVKEYIYKTSQDERVRETHARLNNKRFELIGDNEGNKRLLEINCRCHREMIFDLD